MNFNPRILVRFMVILAIALSILKTLLAKKVFTFEKVRNCCLYACDSLNRVVVGLSPTLGATLIFAGFQDFVPKSE